MDSSECGNQTASDSQPGKIIRAIGLHSGGLDSILADKLVRSLGVEVRAIHFFTGLCGESKEDMAREDSKLGISRELVDISGDEYIHMVTHPRFGYGAHANPCIDCRILMLTKARELMESWGAQFVFTGEVLGQRPKSQRRDAMAIVERESGLTGRLLRPLSAQFLDPTIPEKEGLIDRSKLLGLKGRVRTPQMQMARAMGITEYPQPAGGCWLTDENFGRRFHELMGRRSADDVTQDDMLMLLTGRHFHLKSGVRVIVSRNEDECAVLEKREQGRYRVDAIGVNGPVALVEGEVEPTEEDIGFISSMVARYGQGRKLPLVTVGWFRNGEKVREVQAVPLSDDRCLDAVRW